LKLKNNIILIFNALILFCFCTLSLVSNDKGVYFEATAFSSDSLGFPRIDVAVAVNYSALKFESVDNIYLSKYSSRITIKDSNDAIVAESKQSRQLKANSLYDSQGGNANFDYFFKSFILQPGNYKVKLNIIDDFTNNDYEINRKVSLLDFDKFDFSMSGTLLVSSIEQTQNGFNITPYLSDNIAPVINSLFTVIEIYNNVKNPLNQIDNDTINFIYVLYNQDRKIITKSDIIQKIIPKGKSAAYFLIKPIKGLKQNENYILRTYALRDGADTISFSNYIIAASERSIEYKRQLGGVSLENIDLAIDQTFYAASSDDMKYMRSGIDEDDKLDRFIQFWKSFDPSPNTERNEAFDLYFKRIELANERYKFSGGEGWRSDQGAASIVYGMPVTVERSNPDYMGRVYERWNYQNGRSLIFLDRNGFGDYRLVQPAYISDKFVFE